MKKKFHLKTKTSDYLTVLLDNGPAAWALIRANEVKSLEIVKFKHPVLDIGCGDGVVAKAVLSTRKEKFEWGIDVSSKEINKARKSGSYNNCKIADIYNLPFKNKTFNTVFSNSVIEHLVDLEKALSEISRVLATDGRFIMTVPSPFLSKYLLASRFFVILKLDFLADLYAKIFHLVLRHRNIYDHQRWKKILAKHNLTLVDYYYYHSPDIIQKHEIFSYLAIPQHLARFVFGHWPLPLRGLFIRLYMKKQLLKYTNKLSKKEGGSLLLISKWSG